MHYFFAVYVKFCFHFTDLQMVALAWKPNPNCLVTFPRKNGTHCHSLNWPANSGLLVFTYTPPIHSFSHI